MDLGNHNWGVTNSQQVDFTTPLTELYEKYEWGDLWSEGHLIDVVRYLRGSKRLTIPEEWRPLLPTELVDEPMD